MTGIDGREAAADGTNEPPGEGGDLDAGQIDFYIGIGWGTADLADRRRKEFLNGSQGATRADRGEEAFFDDFTGKVGRFRPIIETHNDDGEIGQINDGANAIGIEQLARADFADTAFLFTHNALLSILRTVSHGYYNRFGKERIWMRVYGNGCAFTLMSNGRYGG